MGNREEFEKWAHAEGLSLATGSGRYYVFDATHNTYVGYSARQPEIDAKDKVIEELKAKAADDGLRMAAQELFDGLKRSHVDLNVPQHLIKNLAAALNKEKSC